MKNFSTYLLITFSIAFAFSSCNVQKRLHNPGYHVQFNSTNKVDKTLKTDQEIVLKESKKEQVSLAETAHKIDNSTANLEQNNEVVSGYAENSSDVASNDETALFETIAANKQIFQDKYTTGNTPDKVAISKAIEKTKTTKTSSSNASGGVALLVLIILCLFPLINLIPVYITDGGITLNFWITLLLNLTYIGAVIFSLLVVLGIVSFA